MELMLHTEQEEGSRCVEIILCRFTLGTGVHCSALAKAAAFTTSCLEQSSFIFASTLLHASDALLATTRVRVLHLLGRRPVMVPRNPFHLVPLLHALAALVGRAQLRVRRAEA